MRFGADSEPGLGHADLMTDLVTALCAVVPACDEEQLIGRCLASLSDARDRAEAEYPGVTIRVIVVADCCTDDTAAIAGAFGGVDVLRIQAGNVGAARTAGVEYAVALLRASPPVDQDLGRAWVANTDADSVVPSNWFTHQIALASSGVDVIVGTVRPDFDDLTDEQISAWTAKRTPGKPNGHVHGANLGIRASSYRLAGGFEAVSEHENNTLVTRLHRVGARIVASDGGDVLTSGRQIGKTPGGYAGYLAHDLVQNVAAL
jgi:glycosyltransferase involved in cell wall biosynthesis